MGFILTLLVEALEAFVEGVEASEETGAFVRASAKTAKGISQLLKLPSKLRSFRYKYSFNKLAQRKAYNAFTKFAQQRDRGTIERYFADTTARLLDKRLRDNIAELQSKLSQLKPIDKEYTKNLERLKRLQQKLQLQEEQRLKIRLNKPSVLVSSWLVLGVFMSKVGEDVGTLWLWTKKGKFFVVPECTLAVWFAMNKAHGTHGSGAGSVLWDTLWQHKRTKSLMTGGVLKNRQLRLARRARTFKRIKYFQKQYTSPPTAESSLAWHSVRRLNRDFKRANSVLKYLSTNPVKLLTNKALKTHQRAYKEGR